MRQINSQQEIKNTRTLEVFPINFLLTCQVNNFFIFPGMSFGAMCLGREMMRAHRPTFSLGLFEGWCLDVLNSQDIPTTKQLRKNAQNGKSFSCKILKRSFCRKNKAET